MTMPERGARRPPGDFGTTGTLSRFKGPYAGGPPPEDLEVEIPAIGAFGPRELVRMVVVYVTLTFSVLSSLTGWLVRRRGRTAFAAASEGAIDGFLRLGPTYVKLGQIIASSPGLFPQALARAAERCLDEVPPFDSATAREMIRRDLGHAPSALFKHFDDAPLSAASIGQVHACVLPDGREAVIKLQRPNIRRRMTTDLRIGYRLAKTLERYFEFARNSAVVALVEDLHAVTYQELNPALEAWRQDEFRRQLWAFDDNQWITAPEIYWDYCGPHMICMERMTGGDLNASIDLTPAHNGGLDITVTGSTEASVSELGFTCGISVKATFTTKTDGSLSGQPVTGPTEQGQAEVVSNSFAVPAVVGSNTGSCPPSVAQTFNKVLGLPAAAGRGTFTAPFCFDFELMGINKPTPTKNCPWPQS